MRNLRNLRRAIERKRNKLIRKYEKTGLYENFGQDEVRDLEDRYIDLSSYTDEMNKARTLIQNFNGWCMTFNG